MSKKNRQSRTHASREASSTGTAESEHQSPLQRAAAGVRRLFSRKKAHASSGRTDIETPIPSESESLRGGERTATPKSRGARREADIPLDRLAQTYTPMQTSMKTSFRTDGADHQRDQDFANGVADDRWNDEDRITNKSGDPRIGTHGRTYEPGESRAEPAENE